MSMSIETNTLWLSLIISALHILIYSSITQRVFWLEERNDHLNIGE